MRRLSRFVLAAALLAALVALAACGGPASSGSSGTSGSSGSSGSSSSGSSVTVNLQNFAIVPSQISVAVGGSVTFVNKDSAQHNIAGDTWQTGPLDSGKSFTQTFPTAGTFPIKCLIHPEMTGTITVK